MKGCLSHIVLPAFVVLLASCKPNVELLNQLTRQVSEMEANGQKLSNDVADQRRLLGAVKDEFDGLSAGRTRLEKEIAEVRDETDRLQEEIAIYKASYRRSVQNSAKGMHLPDFDFDGRSYHGMTVTSVTDTELAVIHSKGSARFPLAKTPASIQSLFGFEAAPKLRPESRPRAPLLSAGVEEALAQGKEAVAEGRRLLDEKKRAAARKKPPRYIAAPTTSGYSWRNSSSFEGSSWAPLKKKNGRPAAATTSNLGKPLP